MVQFLVGGPQSENKRKRKDRQVLGPCQRTEKVVELEGKGDTNCSWRAWNWAQKVEKDTRRIGN